MKAILEFNLPEEQDDHAYALAGVDALLCIDDLFNEIRNKLKYDGGDFKEWESEVYRDDGTIEKKRMTACDYTLERVAEVLLQLKEKRKLPDLV
jgi:uncharacterized protein YggL (DUF469 family)